jgi:hypothetical protein
MELEQNASPCRTDCWLVMQVDGTMPVRISADVHLL